MPKKPKGFRAARRELSGYVAALRVQLEAFRRTGDRHALPSPEQLEMIVDAYLRTIGK